MASLCSDYRNTVSPYYFVSDIILKYTYTVGPLRWKLNSPTSFLFSHDDRARTDKIMCFYSISKVRQWTFFSMLSVK